MVLKAAQDFLFPLQVQHGKSLALLDLADFLNGFDPLVQGAKNLLVLFIYDPSVIIDGTRFQSAFRLFIFCVSGFSFTFYTLTFKECIIYCKSSCSFHAWKSAVNYACVVSPLDFNLNGLSGL